MDFSFKFWKTTDKLKLFLWYAVSIALIVLGRFIDPGSVVGPGIDVLFLLLLVFCWFVFFFYSLTRVLQKDRRYVQPLLIHAAMLTVFLFFVAWLFFCFYQIKYPL